MQSAELEWDFPMELGLPAYPTIYLGRNEPLEFVWEGFHGVYLLAQGKSLTICVAFGRSTSVMKQRRGR